MNIKRVKDALGRARLYYQKGDTVTSLKYCILGLNEVVKSSQSPSTEIRSLIRAVSQGYAANKELLKLAKSNLTYQPEQEKVLLQGIERIYAAMTEEKKETKEETRNRKKALDTIIAIGKRYLSSNNASEADEAFQKASTLYRDEKYLFLHLGKILFEANQIMRALPYLKKAIELNPDNMEAVELYDKALEFKENRST